MFDQILQMATSEIKNQLTDHSEISQDTVEKVSSTASQSIFSTITEQLSSGNFEGITEMLNGKDTTNSAPATQSITNPLVSSLVEKTGLNEDLAKKIATIAVPRVMNMLNSNVNGTKQAENIDISSMMSNILGSNEQESGGLGGMLSSFLNNSSDKNNKPETSGQDILGSILGNFLK